MRFICFLYSLIIINDRITFQFRLLSSAASKRFEKDFRFFKISLHKTHWWSSWFFWRQSFLFFFVEQWFRHIKKVARRWNYSIWRIRDQVFECAILSGFWSNVFLCVDQSACELKTEKCRWVKLESHNLMNQT